MKYLFLLISITLISCSTKQTKEEEDCVYIKEVVKCYPKIDPANFNDDDWE